MANGIDSTLATSGVSSNAPAVKAAPGTCCGGPAPAGIDACCARDAEVQSTGASGCGCSAPAPAPAKKTACCG
jgi:hypothetical protein